MPNGVPGAGYVLASLAVMGLVTLALRAMPFVALRRFGDSGLIAYLGRVLPAGVMIILVLYTVPSFVLDPTTVLGSAGNAEGSGGTPGTEGTAGTTGPSPTLATMLGWVPVLGATAVTVVLHWWKRRSGLTVFGGLAVYLLLRALATG